MGRDRLSILAVVMSLLLGPLCFGGSAAAAAPGCGSERPASAAEQTTEGPIRIDLELKEAGLAQGIRLRVTYANNGPGAISLSVCPAMLLCCVKGLHPLVTCEGTGIGLLDVCKGSNPTTHETFLPANSAFSFELNIPPDRLPPSCTEKGKSMSVCVCYETDEARVVCSNTVKTVMN